MEAATVFKNGRSTQAIRIPKKFRFRTPEVWIDKVGDCLVITPKPVSWDDFFNSSQQVTDDFDMTRDQAEPQDRSSFL
ncbi:MAG: type II toxin-antitoxin system VapB family antitoxin [Myxococcaceae bacterium]